MCTCKWNRFVPVILVGLICATGVRALAFADDGDDKPPAKPATTKVEAPAPLTERERLLLDRVEQLEKRVADLEGKANPSAASGADAAAEQPAAPSTTPGTTSGTTPNGPDLVSKAATATEPQATDKRKLATSKAPATEPFTFADFTSLNRNPRT